MKNILNNKTAISKGLVKSETSVSIGNLENRWIASVNEKNEYIILKFSNPLGTRYFKNETDFILHLEGNHTLGRFKANPSHWSY